MKRAIKLTIPVLALLLIAATAVLVASDFQIQAAQETHQNMAAIPSTVNYQGFLIDKSGTPVEGTVKLQFDLYESSADGSSLWSEIHTDVPVTAGYFVVQLGSVTPLSTADFELPSGDGTRYIQITITNNSDAPVVLPRQPLAAVPYAFLAEKAAYAPWQGLSGIPSGFADNVDDVEFQNVVTVALAGGQFSDIQAAVDSITSAGPENRFLVWVAPGRYQEQVTLKPYVDLAGAGRSLTIIESSASNPDTYPPTAATLVLSEHSMVRDLTVKNNGTGQLNVAVLATNGSQESLLTAVSAEVNGVGSQSNYGIYIHGITSTLTLDQLSVHAENGQIANVGLRVGQGAKAAIEGGNYTAKGGQYAIGIEGYQVVELTLSEVTVKAADAISSSYGINLSQDALANIHGGHFEARTGFTETMGIALWSGAELIAIGVQAEGADSPNWNKGLSVNGATAVLDGGHYIGRGGTETYGIINLEGGQLEANSVIAFGEKGTDRNDGLRNERGAMTLIYGGRFHADGGSDNRGIANYGSNSFVDLNQVTAHGLGNGSDAGFGLSNESEGMAFASGSELWGTSSAVLSDGTTTRLDLTRLVGGNIAGTGEVICVGVTWAQAFYADTCP